MIKTWNKTTRGKLQFPKKWRITIFLAVFSFFIIFFLFFDHFCFQWWNWWKMIKQWWKMIKWKKHEKKTRGTLQFSKKWKIAIFLEFFSFFLIFLSCFIIFASSGAKIFRKIKNCNFPRFFSLFYHVFYHFYFQWWNWWKMIKNDEKW